MKKLFTLIAIVLTLQCFSQNSGPTGIFDSDELEWDLDTTGGMTGGGAFMHEESIKFTRSGSMTPTDILYMSDDSAYYIAGQRIITERDIERWIEHCNDSIHYPLEIVVADSFFHNGYSFHYDTVFTNKNPNDIVGLLKWLKQTK